MECDGSGGKLLQEAFEVAWRRSSFCQSVCEEAVNKYMWLVGNDAGVTPVFSVSVWEVTQSQTDTAWQRSVLCALSA